jgi:3-phosphoshikimate 1-carboxyvinyltransferase
MGGQVTSAVEVRVPGDKSISHRALILAVLASGTSRITGLLDSADVRSSARVLRGLGADISDFAAEGTTVIGRGSGNLRAPSAPLDCGNSGTTARLLAGVAAALPFETELIGDESLSRRPMRRVARPLEAMGARVLLAPGDTLPMRVRGARLEPLDWESETSSAQVKSAILLAGLAGRVTVTVREQRRSRDHTERMLRAMGASVEQDGATVRLRPGTGLAAVDRHVPGDPSSAAFLAAFAAMAEGVEVVLPDVCVNPTRAGFFALLQRMGARISMEERREQAGELLATLRVKGGAELGSANVTATEVPSMIDELPLLACVAARAAGETVIEGAAELRVKESDRIAAVVAGLRAVGVEAEERPDGLRVVGGSAPLAGRVTTRGDHRLAMAFGVLGALPGNEIEVDDPECVAVSYPDFWRDLARVAR